MSFTAFTNIITILFCLAVLVQSVRMMRSLNQVRNARLDETVLALSTATAQAQNVLSGMRETLAGEGTANAKSVAQATELREELNVLIGIANAMAERLVDAASNTSKAIDAPSKPAPARKPAVRAAKAPAREPVARRTKPASHDATKARKTA